MFTFPICHWSAQYILQPTQYGSITIPISSASATASINAVGSLAVLFPGNFKTTEGFFQASTVLPRIELTNPTTVTAYRNSASVTGSVTVYFAVVDFSSNFLTKVDYGTIALSSVQTTNSASVSSNFQARAMINLGFTCANTGASAAQTQCAMRAGDSFTIHADRTNSGSAAATVGYCYLGFNPGILKSVTQAFLVTVLNTNSVDTTSVSPTVDPNNTMMFWGGLNPSGASYVNTMTRAQLTAGNTITFTRQSTNNNQRKMYCSLAELIPGVFKSNIQRSTTLIDSGTGTPSDTSINAVNVDKSVGYYMGGSCAGTTPDEIFASVNLLNTSTLRVQKNSTTTASNISWEVPEFN